MTQRGTTRIRRSAVRSQKFAEQLTRGDFIVALMIFFVNASICLVFFGPERQGYGDVVRGWHQFNEYFSILGIEWGPSNQIELRLILLFISLLEVFVLRALKLIDPIVLATYLALPFSAYLATKIRLEFVFFPFALISTNLTIKKEIAVIGTLIGLSLFLDENNGYVIVAYRVVLLLLKLRNLRWIFLLPAIAILVIITDDFDTLANIFPAISDYSYTRDVANPDYSIAETAGVLIGSAIVSVNPYIDYPISIPIGILVCVIALGKRVLDPTFWRAAVRSRRLKAAVITILTFTSITHAFQNGRYYFFFVPPLASALGVSGIRRLMFLSVFATVMLTLFYTNLDMESQRLLQQIVEDWGPRL